MDNQRIASLLSSITARGWRWWVPRLLSGSVGLILLTAGLLKSGDMDLFIRQIRDYGIISHHQLIALGAWGLIIVECGLGAALLISYLPGLSISIAAFLFLIFIGVNIWAFYTGVTEDCGCFGAWIKRTPGEALIEDLVLLAALFPAWLGQRRSPEPPTRTRSWIVMSACILGLLLPILFGSALSLLNRSQSDYFDIKHYLSEIQGLGKVDLKNGTHLIVLMDTGCSHCQETFGELNLISQEADAPPIIALSINNETQREIFVEEFQPAFPVEQIPEQIFLRLLGDGDMPRIILIRDQSILKVWDERVPDILDIKDVLAQSS